MRLIYNLLIYLYGLLLRGAAFFTQKAKFWVEGRRGLFENLERSLNSTGVNKQPLIWFHVSSLGEFEQGRPVIEALRKKRPDARFLLTFFSPSGYNVRKSYNQADVVCYLPLDTPANMRKFIRIVRPEMVFFVKYDFWFNCLQELHNQQITVYFISAIFRKNQHFFKFYGGWFRRHLQYVTHFFVQNSESAELLKKAGIAQVTVSGDTRFDRVYTIASHMVDLPFIQKFANNRRIFVAGSSWEPDEAVFLPVLNQKKSDLKFIIAPHDTSEARIRQIRGQITLTTVCYSELNETNAATAEVLIIDCVGILAQIYRYAYIAYIGGGFGSGLHNIQEPVTFGVPVFFGPHYQKFKEAVDLVNLGGVISINTTTDLVVQVDEILQNPDLHQRLSAICRQYVDDNRGATNKILQFLGMGSGL